jgi:hypothetical protein
LGTCQVYCSFFGVRCNSTTYYVAATATATATATAAKISVKSDNFYVALVYLVLDSSSSIIWQGVPVGGMPSALVYLVLIDAIVPHIMLLLILL